MNGRPVGFYQHHRALIAFFCVATYSCVLEPAADDTMSGLDQSAEAATNWGTAGHPERGYVLVYLGAQGESFSGIKAYRWMSQSGVALPGIDDGYPELVTTLMAPSEAALIAAAKLLPEHVNIAKLPVGVRAVEINRLDKRLSRSPFQNALGLDLEQLEGLIPGGAIVTRGTPFPYALVDPRWAGARGARSIAKGAADGFRKRLPRPGTWSASKAFKKLRGATFEVGDLRVRPATSSDLEELKILRSDPDVEKFAYFHPVQTAENSDPNEANFVIEKRDRGSDAYTFVGWAQLQLPQKHPAYQAETDPRAAYSSIALTAQHRKQGNASVVGALLDDALRDAGFLFRASLVSPKNDQSIALMGRRGYHQTGKNRGVLIFTKGLTPDADAVAYFGELDDHLRPYVE